MNFFFGLGFFIILENEAIVCIMLCMKCFDVTRLMLIIFDVGKNGGRAKN